MAVIPPGGPGDPFDQAVRQYMGEKPRPINWRDLTPGDAVEELVALDEWVSWLRVEYGLPAAIIPPLWHRHPELIWELSALHLLWVHCYDSGQDAGAPITFHERFAAARDRLRYWVAASGTRLDRDRPTRVTPWPGEPATEVADEQPIGNRQADFDDFLDGFGLNENAQPDAPAGA